MQLMQIDHSHNTANINILTIQTKILFCQLWVLWLLSSLISMEKLGFVTGPASSVLQKKKTFPQSSSEIYQPSSLLFKRGGEFLSLSRFAVSGPLMGFLKFPTKTP